MHDAATTDEELRLRKRRSAVGPRSLPLVGVCSLFTCIVLILFPFAESAFANPASPSSPPYSTSRRELKAAVAVMLLDDGFRVDGKPIRGIFGPDTFERLRRELVRVRTREPMCSFAEDCGRARWLELRDNLLLVADEDTPYAVISATTSAAYAAGYVNIALVTRYTP